MNKIKRRTIIIEERDNLVSYKGGILIDGLIHRLSLPQIIDTMVKLKGRERGYKESEAIPLMA